MLLLIPNLDAVERTVALFSIMYNANTTDPGASNIVLKYDEQEVGFYNATLNTPKTFTRNLYTPEAYIISNDAYYSRLYVGAGVTKVPLGIALRRAMNVTFQQVYNEGFTTMILVDEKTGKEYDLLTRSYTTDKLAKGTTEGRFYLKFAVEEQDDFQDYIRKYFAFSAQACICETDGHDVLAFGKCSRIYFCAA